MQTQTLEITGLRLDTLGTPIRDMPAATHWSDVQRQITSGEMPPAKHQAQPSPAERDAMLTWLNTLLQDAERASVARGGRVVMRRLNRVEYERTVRDLLDLDERFSVVDELPVENKVEGFDTVGAALAPALVKAFLARDLKVQGERVKASDSMRWRMPSRP